jgi:FtsP/CotA-like multicopper oxidase with cupredoxin domain
MQTRRRFLKDQSKLILSGLAIPALGFGRYVNPFATNRHELELEARPQELNMFAGHPTRIWKFTGKTKSSLINPVENLSGSCLGPILRFQRGDVVSLKFNNHLDEPSIVHWHGFIVPEKADGHPHRAVGPGKSYQYDFEVKARAGTYWYHPHPHGRTGEQVARGLAGLIIVSDPPNEPTEFQSIEDIPLVLQDKAMDDNNQILYEPMMMMGYFGETILVNGLANFKRNVKAQPYRLRILNGANARIFKLGWSTGEPLTVIATDGGLLPRPVQKDFIIVSPSERVEIWADFNDVAAGTKKVLQALPFYNGEEAAKDLAPFTVTEPATVKVGLPESLSSESEFLFPSPVNAEAPKVFNIIPDRSMGWTINGLTYRSDDLKDYERVRAGTSEIWEINSGQMMPHPFHIHACHIKVLDRQTRFPEVAAGIMDLGLKDSVFLMPEDKVRIQVKFGEHPGLYMYHCHNLEHEDMGMMRDFAIL